MMACFAIAGVGMIIALQSNWLQFLGGVLPGATWFGTSAVKGTAMTYVEGKLRTSSKYFAILERDGNLVSTQPAKTMPTMKPSAGAVSNGK